MDANPDNYIPHSIKQDELNTTDANNNSNINDLSIIDNKDDYVCVLENSGIEYPELVMGLSYRIARTKQERMELCKKKGFKGAEKHIYIRKEDWINPKTSKYECGVFNNKDGTRKQYTNLEGTKSDMKFPSKQLCNYYSNNELVDFNTKMIPSSLNEPVYNLRVKDIKDNIKYNSKSKIFWISFVTITLIIIIWTVLYHVKKPYYFYDYINEFYINKIILIILIFSVWIYLFCPFNTCYHNLDTPLYRRDFNKYTKNIICKFAKNNTGYLEENLYYKYDNSNLLKILTKPMNFIINLNQNLKNYSKKLNKICNSCETKFNCIPFKNFYSFKLFKPEIIDIDINELYKKRVQNRIRSSKITDIINELYKYKKINVLFQNINQLNNKYIVINKEKNTAKINNIEFEYIETYGFFNFAININSRFWSIKVSDSINGKFIKLDNNQNISSKYIQIYNGLHAYLLFKNSIYDSSLSYYYGPYDTGTLIRIKPSNNLYMCCLINDSIFINMILDMAKNDELKDCWIDRDGTLYKGFSSETRKAIIQLDILKNRKLRPEYVKGEAYYSFIKTDGSIQKIKVDSNNNIKYDDKIYIGLLKDLIKSNSYFQCDDYNYKWIQVKDRKGETTFNNDIDKLYLKKCIYSNRIISVDNNYELLDYNISISTTNFVNFFKSNSLNYFEYNFFPSFYLEDLKSDNSFNKEPEFIRRKLIKIYRYFVKFPGYKYIVPNYSILGNDIIIYNNNIKYHYSNLNFKNILTLNNYIKNIDNLILKLNEINDYYNDDEDDIKYTNFYGKTDDVINQNKKIYNKYNYILDKKKIYNEIDFKNGNLSDILKEFYISISNLNYIQRQEIREYINDKLLEDFFNTKNDDFKLFIENKNNIYFNKINKLKNNNNNILYNEKYFIQEYDTYHNFYEYEYLKDNIKLQCKLCKQFCNVIN